MKTQKRKKRKGNTSKVLGFEPIVNDTTAIAGVLYTFSESVLKMSVFFPPLYPKESTKVQIDVVGKESGMIHLDECEILPFM